ncbi:MAG: ABC transporter substrate-binding protein [Magnetococcales bacterium]|nr:ABC transporter substrate-binding protein [Magnetococcales bacterium]MBF0151168.1 ABC transporter substrate-binding protein [Magnetococcales bacterium]MBF0174632.1 ABC transporter substrate-binding protein [Magnetococcales bacterium]MBF0348674.1 ABC transporter substrate-binding protein [Magnetococcales bacterium]MBF0632650.1 ABC transporter substrate-binding protein [Magnetococcales bacterium]
MRRHYRFMGLAAFIFSLFSVVAFASQNPSTARMRLENTVRQALAVLQNPAYAPPEQRETKRKLLQEIIYPEFDFQRMSQAAVGQPWKKFSTEQQERFTLAFRTMLENTYFNMIERYSGEEVTFTNEVPLSNQVLRVDSVVVAKGQKYDMSYRMYPKGDQWLVFDIIIEGVSVISNYRSQFKQLLQSANPDIEGLLVRMQEKNNENKF